MTCAMATTLPDIDEKPLISMLALELAGVREKSNKSAVNNEFSIHVFNEFDSMTHSAAPSWNEASRPKEERRDFPLKRMLPMKQKPLLCRIVYNITIILVVLSIGNLE